MAEINIKFNSVDKTLAVTMDGAAIENVRDLQIGPSWDEDDEFCCCISTITIDEVNDMRTITRLIASKKGVREEKVVDIQVAIAKYLEAGK